MWTQSGFLTLAYGRTVAEGLGVVIPDRSFTVIVGPNACGKTTLLRALSRMLKPRAGSVLLDGAAIASYPAKEVNVEKIFGLPCRVMPCPETGTPLVIPKARLVSEVP